jgi:hypothetical protein
LKDITYLFKIILQLISIKRFFLHLNLNNLYNAKQNEADVCTIFKNITNAKNISILMICVALGSLLFLYNVMFVMLVPTIIVIIIFVCLFFYITRTYKGTIVCSRLCCNTKANSSFTRVQKAGLNLM